MRAVSSMSVEAAGWALEPAVPGSRAHLGHEAPLGQDRGEAKGTWWFSATGWRRSPCSSNPIGEVREPASARSSGAINIFKRAIDGHLVTALGEAPEAAVRRIGEGIRPEAR